MTTAFAQFDEPLAWLIRGLVEYGYADISLESGLKPGTVGGFDARLLTESQGRSGLLLKVPAVSGGTRHHQDDIYVFEVYLSDHDDRAGFTVRCAECNYLADFPFDPTNPVWAAGYIHQSLSEYVPEFVQWRLSGGQLTWAQRQGIPTVIGEPCSASLATWCSQQLSLNQPLDGRHWGAGPAVIAPTGPVSTMPVGPIAMEGNLGRPTGTANNPLSLARAQMTGPTNALMAAIGVGGVATVAAVLNILITLVAFGFDRPFALVTSLLFIAANSALATGAWAGLRRLKAFEDHPLAWLTIAYPAFIPVCCIAGIPLSVWAGMRWQSPAVRAIRTQG